MTNEISSIGFVYQLMIVLTGYFIKPAHMIITGLIIKNLKRASSDDIKIIRLGMIIFFAGEVLCAANYFFADDNSLILDILHDILMTGLSGIVLLGVFNFVDSRIIHFTSPGERCQFQKLCGKCWKVTDVTCKINNAFYLVLGSAIVMSLIPFSIDLKPINETFSVFGTPLNCSLSTELLFFKFRILPCIAVCLFLITLDLLVRKQTFEQVKIVFFSGCGFMLYSLMVFFFVESFRSLPFMAYFWEEATELISVVCVGYFLYIFRDSYS